MSLEKYPNCMLVGWFWFSFFFRKNANISIRTHRITTKGEFSLTLTGTRSYCSTADLNGQRQNICMPHCYRKVDINSSLLRSVLGGRACIAFSTDKISSTHAELLPDSWHISIKSTATCNCVQELEQIAVWFSSCSRGSAAAGTASSWFKASPGMRTWPALGELTGRHDLLPAPDYTAASRSPWALWWFTSVLSPKLHFFLS